MIVAKQLKLNQYLYVKLWEMTEITTIVTVMSV